MLYLNNKFSSSTDGNSVLIDNNIGFDFERFKAQLYLEFLSAQRD
jgi:hypothetical protein